jgi:hypothetical protein
MKTSMCRQVVVLVALVLAILSIACSGKASPDKGQRFLGTWHSVTSGEEISISKNGDQFMVEDNGVIPCDLVNGSLHSETPFGDVTFIESSGSIKWRGKEFKK